MKPCISRSVIVTCLAGALRFPEQLLLMRLIRRLNHHSPKIVPNLTREPGSSSIYFLIASRPLLF